MILSLHDNLINAWFNHLPNYANPINNIKVRASWQGSDGTGDYNRLYKCKNGWVEFWQEEQCRKEILIPGNDVKKIGESFLMVRWTNNTNDRIMLEGATQFNASGGSTSFTNGADILIDKNVPVFFVRKTIPLTDNEAKWRVIKLADMPTVAINEETLGRRPNGTDGNDWYDDLTNTEDIVFAGLSEESFFSSPYAKIGAAVLGIFIVYKLIN